MGFDTLSHEPDDDGPSPAIYWRRRFLALVTGLAILGTIAWAFSGALGGNPTGSNTADVGHAPGGHRPAAPATRSPAGAAAGSSAGAAAGSQGSGVAGVPAGPGTPAPTAPATATPGSGAQQASAGQPGSPGSRAGQGAAGPGPAGGPAACSPADVVLSLFASQASYGQSQPPEFDVDVVSTAAGTCTFNIGPRFLDLVIRAGGKRVWGSADCAAAPGSLVDDLTRGVPAVLPVAWDLQTSAPGCPVAAGPAAAGAYAATASDGGIASNPVTFRLSWPG